MEKYINKNTVNLYARTNEALIQTKVTGIIVEFPGLGGNSCLGGFGAIIYSIESKHNIAACGAACPCCDVLDRFHCKDSFARTFIRAVADYDMPMEEALKTISPMHRIGDMRKIPYFLVNCCDDEVFPEAQLDEYVGKLKEMGHDVVYRKMPGKKHGEFIPEVKIALYDFLYSYA